MKTFKTSFIALIFILGTGIVSAQEYKIAVANPKEGRLVLKDFNGTLPIEGYNGTEIIITSKSGEFSPPEKAKGLKPIYPAGSDNTGIGLRCSEDRKYYNNQMSYSIYNRWGI